MTQGLCTILARGIYQQLRGDWHENPNRFSYARHCCWQAQCSRTGLSRRRTVSCVPRSRPPYARTMAFVNQARPGTGRSRIPGYRPDRKLLSTTQASGENRCNTHTEPDAAGRSDRPSGSADRPGIQHGAKRQSTDVPRSPSRTDGVTTIVSWRLHTRHRACTRRPM